MHMLHTRRKAEIEIICSTRPVPSSFSTTRQIFAHKQERNKIHPEDQDDQIMDSSTGSDLYDGSSLPPLLRYLLRKISDFVGSNT
jgi:hypothetical protein